MSFGRDMAPDERRWRNRQIIVAYARGDRVKDIADRMGVTGRTVSRIAEQMDIQRPVGRNSYWPDCPSSHRKFFAKMLRNGLSPADARAAIEREVGL